METTRNRPQGGRTTSKVLRIMGIFGSVQVVSILCSIARVKIVALWIGAAGIGLFGIFDSAMTMINNLCQMRLCSSSVRDLAAAPRDKLPALVQSVRRWAWLLGLAGAVLTLALAVPLSMFSFGDRDHAWSFALLSVTVFLASLTGGESAVFQGLKRYRKLAMGGLWGAVGGLIVSIPMFWFWRIDSIVPSIMAYSVCTWIAIGLYHERVPRPDQPVPFRDSLALGKKFIILGAFLTASEFITSLLSFVFMSWLNWAGSTDEVGYFQAGFTVVNRYVGLIFTAIAMEYYPRLSQVAASRSRMSLFVSHETGVVMLLLIPLITVFIAADRWIVWALYKKDFLVILPFVSWAIVGTVLRAFSWCMSFAVLARGDGKVYLLTEALSGCVFLGANMAFYWLWGIPGMGVAYVVWYGAYCIIVGKVFYGRYGLSVSREALKITGVALAVTASAATLKIFTGWGGAAVVAVLASAWSLRQLKVSFLKGELSLRGLLRGRRDPKATR